MIVSLMWLLSVFLFCNRGLNRASAGSSVSVASLILRVLLAKKRGDVDFCFHIVASIIIIDFYIFMKVNMNI